MKPKFWETAQFVFKFCCFIVVVCMISVWFKKYLKDEDLCLVDYIDFKTTTEIEHPKLSLCYINPFIDQNFEKFGIDYNEYINHLRGDVFNKNPYKN